MSKAAALAKRPRSIFLAPPGSTSKDQDRYNLEETDWSEIPRWRLASFFGIRARGQFFVYVVDQSGSMLDDDRLIRAKIELRRSVFALQPPQRFEVIFYNDEATPMPGGPQPRPADPRNKNLLNSWLRLIGPDGETVPRSAVGQAIALRPDAIFLLSDGEYPDGTVEAIARAQSRQDPHPLRGPLRRPGRRPPQAHRPRQRRPVRLPTRQPSGGTVIPCSTRIKVPETERLSLSDRLIRIDFDTLATHLDP